MLYKYGGSEKIHGDYYSYIIVNSGKIDEYLEQGWSRTTAEAKDLSAEPKKEESSEGIHEDTPLSELRAMAEGLGLKSASKKGRKYLIDYLNRA